MFSASIETEDFGRWLDEVQRKMDDAVHVAWTSQTIDARDSQKQYHYRNRTHRLSDSMRFTVERRGEFHYKSVLTTDAAYALWVDGPTKAHRIAARRVKYLRFFSAKEGRFVFRKSVMHPGTAGAGFSEHARQYFNVKAGKAVQQAVDAVASSS